ncbi:MAG TPA: hypothetical protein VMU35_01940 [Methylomirabilota bacterium]|nr:hypothetical protein [Methylomirabilota bacterium]
MEDGTEATKIPVKLEIDRPQDFKFHLAYDVYSKAWDASSSDPVRAKLNELITSLAGDENGYQSFYSQIQEYRQDGGGGFRVGRTRIETASKRAWQRTENREGRNRRHH